MSNREIPKLSEKIRNIFEKIETRSNFTNEEIYKRYEIIFREKDLWNTTIEFFDKINVEKVLKEIENE